MKKIVSLVLALVLCLGVMSFAMADSFGLGVSTGIGSSKAAYTQDGQDYDGRAQVDSTICAVVLNDEGVIKSIHFDVAQTRVTFNVKGELTADLGAEIKSKMELQDAYGMKNASSIGKEWFEQVAAFEAYCIGKKPADIIGMETYERDASHPAVPAVEDLKTVCTMTMGDFFEALAKAVENATAL